MRVLFVIRSVRNFSYHSSTVQQLCRRGHSVRVVVASLTEEVDSYPGIQSALESCRGLLTIEKQTVRGLEAPISWASKLRELRSYASYLRRPDQSTFYRDRWEGYLSNFLKRFVKFPFVKQFLSTQLAHSLLTWIETWAPSDPKVLQFLKETAPQAVVASPMNLVHSLELEYVKAAKELGIPTLVSVHSWDNLTTKGLLHIEPDRLLAWNQAHLDQAVAIHGIHSQRIKITGSPFFDKWLGLERSQPDRSRFFEKVGLDPSRPFLLYLGSAASITEDETWVVKALVGSLRKHSHPRMRDLQVLARPHPSNSAAYERESSPEFAIWPRAGSLPDTEDSLRDFFESVHFSVAAIGLNTTGMIDAILLGKPCFSMLLPEFQITQSRALHFQDLMGSRTLYLSKSVDEAVSQVEKAYLRGEDPLANSRKEFTRDFARPLGDSQPAGFHAAVAIEDCVRKAHAPEKELLRPLIPIFRALE